MSLSWREQNIVAIGPVYSKLERSEFSSNFEFNRNMLSGTGARVDLAVQRAPCGEQWVTCTHTWHQRCGQLRVEPALWSLDWLLRSPWHTLSWLEIHWRVTRGCCVGAVVGVSSLCSTCCYSLGVGWGLWAKRLIGCATHVATAWGEVRAPSRRGFDLCVTPVNAAWGVVKAPWVFWFNCCVVPVATA